MTILIDTLSAVAYPATGAPIDLTVIGASPAFDETWAPYVQLDLTVATPGLSEYIRIDPRGAVTRVTVTFAQTSPVLAGMTLDLVLRGRTKGKVTGTTVLALESDESLLQDYPNLNVSDLDVGNLVGSSVSALSRYVLAKIGATLAPPLTPGVLFGKNLVSNPGGPYGETVELGRNYYKNPSFESGFTAYTSNGNNTLLDVVATQARTGIRSLRSRASAGGTVAFSLREPNQPTVAKATPDEPTAGGLAPRWQASAYVRANTTSRTFTLEIQGMDATGADYGASVVGTPVVSTSAGWTRISVVAQVSAPAFRVIVRSTTAMAASEAHFWDDIMVTKGAINLGVLPYYSFDTPAADGLTYGRGEYDNSNFPTLPNDTFSESVMYGVAPASQVSNIPGGLVSGWYDEWIVYNSPTSPLFGTAMTRIRYQMTRAPQIRALITAALGEAIKAGGTYVASGYLRVSRANRYKLRVTWLDAAGAALATADTPEAALVAATWTRFSTGAIVAPVGAVAGTLAVWQVTGTGGTLTNEPEDTVDVDGLMVSEQGVIEAFFDGDTADGGGYDYRWRGVPGYSISLRNLDSTPRVNPDSAIWKPGQTAWDFLEPLLQQGNYRLFADEGRVWHLVPRTSYTVPGLVELADGYEIEDYTDETSRDLDWWDAAVVEYRWTDGAGLAHVAYDVASSPGFTKGTFVRYPDTAYPGPGAAAGILARGLARARRFRVAATSDYTVRPGMASTVTTDGETINGVVSAVSHAWPAAAMSVSIRNS